jgi:hypothetical protein
MNNLIVGIYTLRQDRGQQNSFYTSMKKTNDSSLSDVQQPFVSLEDPISQSGAQNHHCPQPNSGTSPSIRVTAARAEDARHWQSPKPS